MNSIIWQISKGVECMEFNNIIEKHIRISEIPTIVLTPRDEKESFSTIIFYHGWSSNKEAQRFRGFILASLGFQVMIPDAIYHGERNALQNYDQQSAVKFFWDIILKNIDESDLLIDYAVNNLNADPERIGVVGHSMGGFTTAGVFTKNKNIKTSVVFNGSFNWEYSNIIFKETLDDFGDINVELQQKIDKFDPIKNIEALIDRPILILHGGSDPVVNIKPQRKFYDKILPLYNQKTKLKFTEFPYLAHFVTTNMMEEASIWFNKYL